MHDNQANQFEDVAEVYDNLMSVVPYRWWMLYVCNLWRQFEWEPRRVLDLACGTGALTRELLRLGYEAEGADLSGAMLEVARRQLPPGTPLWQQDARELDLPSPPFDAAICLFDSLNYILELEGLERAFVRLRRHLVPEGLFVFDMNAIHALSSGMFDQTGTGKDPSLEYEWHSAWDAVTRRCTIHMEFRDYRGRTPRVFHETHVQRGYTVPEVTGALEAAGWEVLAVFDAFSTNPPRARSDRYYFVAQRPVEDAATAEAPARVRPRLRDARQ